MNSKNSSSKFQTNGKSTKRRKLLPSSVFERIEAMISVRQAWVSATNILTVAKSTHVQFVDYILSLFDSIDGDNADSPVFKLLYLYLGTQRVDLYSKEQVKELVSLNSESRVYRIVTALHNFESIGDNRILQVFNWMMHNRKKFSLYSLLNTFFSTVKNIKHTAPRGDHGIWRTHPATNFQRLLFMFLLCEIYHSKFVSSDEAVVEEKKSDSKSVSPSEYQLLQNQPLTKFKTERNAQRVGFLVQFLTCQWDSFVETIQFTNVEEMIQAYVYFNPENNRLEVVPNRNIGYVRKEASNNFYPTLQTTLVAEETFFGVTDYPDNVDKYLRTLSNCFLNDIRKLVFTNSLYGQIDQMEVAERLKPYKFVNNNSLPTRFKTFETIIAQSVSASRNSLFPVLSRNRCRTKHNRSPPSTNNEVSGRENNSQEDLTSAAENDEDPASSTQSVRVDGYQKRAYYKRLEMHNLVKKNISMETLEEACKNVSNFLQKKVYMFNCSFENLLFNIENCDSPPNVSGRCQLVLTDPPFNIRRTRSKPNSDYDQLFPQDMDKTIQSVDEFLRPGGHAIIFCSTEQFPQWENLFSSYVSRQSAGSSDKNIGTGKTFTVDQVPMYFINKSNVSKSFPGRLSTSLQSNLDLAIHVKKNGKPFTEEKDMVNYKCFNYVHSSFNAFKNTIDNVPGLASNEGLNWSREKDENRRRYLVRPEQKCLPLLKELISRFTQPGDIVVDLFAGSFSTAIACLTLPQHRLFVGSEKEEDCFNLAKTHVEKQFAFFMSEPVSVTDIQMDDIILESAIRVTHLTKEDLRFGSKWKAPDGFPQYQLFPIHIILHFTCNIQSPDFFKQYCESDLAHWPGSMQEEFNTLDYKQLLQSEQSAFKVMVMPSNIKHKDAGLGLFAAKTFEKGDIICFYYGTLVYHYLGTRKIDSGTYGCSGNMGATVERFRRYGMQVMIKGSAFDGLRSFTDGKQSVFIVPPPFCAASYINDWRYDEEDEEYDDYVSRTKTLANKRIANVCITQNPEVVTDIDTLKKFDLIVYKALRFINRGEELYTDYGRTELIL